jgi:DNA repair protein RecN (Recombination protein N)
MLKFLNISNFAVIRFLSVDFYQGLNVLTGETGAGKSIIVDALGLLLGARAFTDVVRTGERLALVEGIFELEGINEQRVRAELGEVGVEITDEEFLTIRREVQLGGRSRIFVNDRSVTLATLKKLQPYLVEIHGQGEQRSLLSPQAHLLLLDDFAGCVELRRKVSATYERWRKAVEELNKISRDKVERERLLEILRFQAAEIDLLNPQRGEEERLLEEKKILTYAERLIELNASAYHELYENEESVLTKLGAVRRTLQALESIDKRFSVLLKTLEESTLSLSDVADTLRSYAGRIEYSPARLSEVEDRLSEFERLKRKYGHGIDDLQEIRHDLARQLDQLANWEEHQETLLDNLEVVQKEYRGLVRQLTSCRKAAVADFEKRVTEDLRHVALERARFNVVIETADEEHPAPDARSHKQDSLENGDATVSHSPAYWTPTGADRVEFHLSANVGEQARPLQRIASGGELSRLMLTLRTICRSATKIQDDLSADTASADTTLVFDEVDTGIGGRVAEAVGRRLKSLAAKQQVLCVTHQPQIARFADRHYAIAKQVEDERTITQIKELSHEERIAEIARMLGVSQEIATARETSQWLLETANEEPPAGEAERKVSGRTRRKKSAPDSLR